MEKQLNSIFDEALTKSDIQQVVISSQYIIYRLMDLC